MDGIFGVVKPAGITSADVCARIRRVLQKKKGTRGKLKVGHGGTLDPLATGVLAVALGEATKTVPYVMDGPKTYHFTVTFGARTSSDDSEGEVLETSDVRPSEDDVRAAMARFLGIKVAAHAVGGLGRLQALRLVDDDPAVDELTPFASCHSAMINPCSPKF